MNKLIPENLKPFVEPALAELRIYIRQQTGKDNLRGQTTKVLVAYAKSVLAWEYKNRIKS